MDWALIPGLRYRAWNNLLLVASWDLIAEGSYSYAKSCRIVLEVEPSLSATVSGDVVDDSGTGLDDAITIEKSGFDLNLSGIPTRGVGRLEEHDVASRRPHCFAGLDADCRGFARGAGKGIAAHNDEQSSQEYQADAAGDPFQSRGLRSDFPESSQVASP